MDLITLENRREFKQDNESSSDEFMFEENQESKQFFAELSRKAFAVKKRIKNMSKVVMKGVGEGDSEII